MADNKKSPLSKPLKNMMTGIRGGNRRMLAKAITLVESLRPDHQAQGRQLLEHLMPHTGKAIRLGITGVPGAGKSTLIEALGMMLVNQGLTLAVLAVDPSSNRSGGSILADKTRMEALSAHPLAFIRPSPSGGSLGGVARKTRETMLVCEAAGFDVIIVETVGTGQSEITVSQMVDFFLVLMISGAGDELQGIKRGVMELADMLVVNKADGDNRKKAEQAQRTYQTALHLLAPNSPGWTVPVTTCSALTGDGLETLWSNVRRHRKLLQGNGELDAKRRRQDVRWMWEIVESELKTRFLAQPGVQKQWASLQKEVVQGRISPSSAADTLLGLAN